jgi:NADPH:quinone reductase-like Zn-dependent oxidoreductase
VRSFHAVLGAGIDGIVCREHDVPEPAPGQLVIRVRACSLNWREVLVVNDSYPLPLAQDVILACDGAGDVVAVGDGVDPGMVGRRVMPNVFPRWLDGPFDFARADQLGGSHDGMLTEYAAVDAAAVVEVPDHLSYEQAACLPCAALTAWNALTGGAGLQVGESVLTLGSGAVSVFAIQIARHAGAHIVSTTASEKRASRLEALGADVTVDRRERDWPARVRDATGGGADHVVEVAGTLEASLQATAVGGELAVRLRRVGRADGDVAADRDRQPRPIRGAHANGRRDSPRARHRSSLRLRGERRGAALPRARASVGQGRRLARVRQPWFGRGRNVVVGGSIDEQPSGPR